MSHTTDAGHREVESQNRVCVNPEACWCEKAKGDILECSQLTGSREALIQPIKEFSSELPMHN